jgi:hypothetical protein
MKMATFFSEAKGRVNLATPEGGSIWQAHFSGFFGKGKQSNRKEK